MTDVQKPKKKLGLTAQILIALALGAVVGLILNHYVPHSYVRDTIFVNGIFYVLGQGFLRLMQMLVVPLVFFSLVTGSMAMGDTEKLGRVGVRTLLFYLITTAVAIALALSVASFINPGVGLDLASVVMGEGVSADTEEVSFTETLLNILPTNPINSLAEGNMLQLIFFALVLGVILTKLSDKTPTLARIMNEGNEVMMTMTNGVMALAPIGVFCLLSRTFADLGFDVFIPLLKYMGSVLLALGLQVAIVYTLLLVLFARVNPLVFYRKMVPSWAFTFATASSNASIPVNISNLERMGVSRRISSFTIPLGATINMDGTSIMQGCAVIFAAQAYGITLSPVDYLTVIATATLASIGTAGIPSVGLITLAMVFSSVGLPIEAIAIIMGIDRILDMTRTAVNTTGDCVVTLINAKKDNHFDEDLYYDRKEMPVDHLREI